MNLFNDSIYTLNLISSGGTGATLPQAYYAALQPIASPVPTENEEFTWLRRRIDDILWKN